jgi:predicted PurR-regulated permease PerM
VADPKRWSNVVFAALFCVALLLFGRILWPFVMPVLLGGFLAVVFMPLQDFLLRRARLSRPAAAGFSTLGVVLLICVPLVVIGLLVARELLGIADQARELLERTDLRAELAGRLPAALKRYVHFREGPASADEAVLSAVTGSVNVLTNVLAAGTELVVDLFLMTVAMYYFFLDGRRLVNEGARLVPLERRYFDAFAKEFKDVAHAIMYGNTLTAMVQGAFGFIGLLIAGVPHPAVWAVAMALVALVPIGGTALVWAPIGVALCATGRVTEGGFLLGWGALVVSTVDNLIRPRLCGSRMALHPLLVFLSMFGGLAVFGMMGLLIGPLIAALFMAMVRIYRRDFLAPATRAVTGLLAGSLSDAPPATVADSAPPPVPMPVMLPRVAADV